jgi:hypothetical protein
LEGIWKEQIVILCNTIALYLLRVTGTNHKTSVRTPVSGTRLEPGISRTISNSPESYFIIVTAELISCNNGIPLQENMYHKHA